MSQLTPWPYKIAIACGIAPIGAGTLILAGYAATRSDWFMVAGVICVYVGIALTILGGIALYWFKRRAQEMKRVVPTRGWGSPRLAIVLLLANYPMAVLYLAGGVYLVSRYTVLIQNRSNLAMQDVRVFGGGCDSSFGSINPGESRRQSLMIKNDGCLQMSAKVNGHEQIIIVDSYVTNGSGTDRVVVLNLQGTFDVQE